MKDYISINKHAWDIKTDIHVESDFYNNEEFMGGRNSLNNIELGLMGDITGKKILHLQCHFGQDSISLARLGANVTAIDFSDTAISKAKEIAKQLNAEVNFICCNIYDLPKLLDEQFDIVYTSYGVIGWLPDLGKWAEIIAKYLKKCGQFIFVEFHPVIWMFDNNIEHIEYSYFNAKEIEETLTGTYADKNADIEYRTISWNHSLAEVFTSLLNSGIQIQSFHEYDYSIHDCFSNTIEFEKGKFRIKHLDDKLPLMYSLVGKKITKKRL